MTEIIKLEQPAIWSFFYDHSAEDHEDQMNELDFKKTAIHNILEVSDNRLLICKTEEFVKNKLANAITTAQLRKLFAIVQDNQLLQKLNEVSIQLIYIIARQNNPTAQEFAQFVKTLIQNIGDDAIKLKRFELFMESIVSYHKYHSKR